jgi:serine/threonine-protein kinase
VIRLSDAGVSHLREVADFPDLGERYEVLERIGRGGMGAVYRAHDRLLERDVAVKVLSAEHDAPALAARLERESRVLARIEHPSIVTVHDAGVAGDGRPYYTMRLVRGRTLGDWAAERSTGNVIRAMLAVCDAVAFANSRGVVHRDLKPGNIMVGEFGEVSVLDWGVAKVQARDDAARGDPAATPGPGDTADGVVMGTPGFMAPEQLAGDLRSIDARTDVFGLGAILRSVSAVVTSGNPRVFAAIVARATASRPAERYSDARALADDLRRWMDGEPVAAYRESLLERVGRHYRRNRTLVLLLSAYAIMRVAFYVWRGF